MNKEYDATVVILNRNGERIIRKCLSSIMDQTIKNIEIIVVDNGSTDKSIELIKSLPSIKLIALNQNLGFTEGC
ncbi:MAG: glycosyltransferase [Candidatus Bathyarchaeia archaeon]